MSLVPVPWLLSLVVKGLAVSCVLSARLQVVACLMMMPATASILADAGPALMSAGVYEASGLMSTARLLSMYVHWAAGEHVLVHPIINGPCCAVSCLP